MSGRTTSASWVRGIVGRLKSAGLDVHALFDEAQLDLHGLDDPDARFATENISRLWELAVARSGDPQIGLAVAPVMQPAGFDVVAYAMMSCRNLLEGLQFLVRYQRIVSDDVTVSLQEEERGWWLKIELSGGKRPVPPQRIEFVLTTLLTFLRWTSGHPVHPLAVEFAHAAPAALHRYAALFECTVLFGCTTDRLLFSRSDLALAPQAANPVLAELHDRYAREQLARMGTVPTSVRARELIIKRLPKGDPARADIAGALCMSERTLQRRLQEEGTTFHQVVDDTRRELAQRYLRQPQLALAQAACLLGFTDQSTFSRACKRWFDLTPTQYRSRLHSASSSKA
ncbi:MAG TPA: AraC family transcriptional regulator [Noviherbaspirillum sp.]|uniref:AraC family transcriptional regulator n=1 Tax=Noviherbaspirillum sp. TaxID=1926288 RepID=UPI002B496C09|nr:AraC family transcriptional regulator [Noviherbaspirillum sp.]HJV86478.1 AraC family transcriptional regulator [Noviherbaspirillum sp.]